MASSVFSADFQVSAAPEQLSSKLGNDVVILNLKSGVYYGLDPVGARVWELIQETKSVGAIRNVILSEFDVEPQQCEADLNDLLGDMQAQGLIQIASSQH
jgi:hypothetical protein